LTLQVLFHIIFGVFERLGLVIPLADDFLGEEASSHVVPTVTIMDFMHYFSSLVWTKTSQIQVRVETGVGFLI